MPTFEGEAVSTAQQNPFPHAAADPCGYDHSLLIKWEAEPLQPRLSPRRFPVRLPMVCAQHQP